MTRFYWLRLAIEDAFTFSDLRFGESVLAQVGKRPRFYMIEIHYRGALTKGERDFEITVKI